MAKRGNGEGTISKRADGRWEAKYKDSAGKRQGIYARSRTEAARLLGLALRAREEGLPAISNAQLVGPFLEKWLESAQPGLGARTFVRYQQYVRIHAVPAIGRIAIARLGPGDLERLYASRLRTGSSPSTVLHLHRVLHRALHQALRWGAVPRNVADLVTPPRVPHREMTALDPEQARALLKAAAGDRLEALYVLALTTGMRQGELLGLQWRDVDLERSSVRVQRSLQRSSTGYKLAEPKTSQSRRQITLGETAVAALRRWRVRQAEDRIAMRRVWAETGLVFTNEIGEHAMSILRVSFPHLLERAGVPRVRFHDLRHSAATLLLAQGVHPKVVSEMLGHSTIAITLDLYSHVTPTMQREAAAQMDDLLAAR